MNPPISSPGIFLDINTTGSSFKYPPDLSSNRPLSSMSVDQSILEGSKENQEDSLEKLRGLEILPDLFNLLIELQSGAILAKDFENNAGSIRLKLSKLKQYLKEVDGINETLQARNNKILQLEGSINKKNDLLKSFKKRIQNEIPKF